MYNNFVKDSWTDPDYWMGINGLYGSASKGLRMVAADLQIRSAIRVTQWKDQQESEYYNDLAYKSKRVMEVITDIKDPVLQYHFYRAVLSERYKDLEAAVYQVQNDQEKAKVEELIQKFETMGLELAPHAKTYQTSAFPEMYRLMEDFDKQRKVIKNTVINSIFYSPLKPRPISTSGVLTAVVVIPCLLIFFAASLFFVVALFDEKLKADAGAATSVFIILAGFMFLSLATMLAFLLWQRGQKKKDKMYWTAKAEYDSKLPAQWEQRKAAEERLNRHPLFAHMDALNQQFEQYAPCIEKLEILEMGFKKKWGSGTKPPQFISPHDFGL